jgi:hypothetical protein
MQLKNHDESLTEHTSESPSEKLKRGAKCIAGFCTG